MTGPATWSAPEARIEMEFLERLPDHLPTPGDVRLRVTLRSERGEAATYDGIWIDRPDLEALVVRVAPDFTERPVPDVSARVVP